MYTCMYMHICMCAYIYIYIYIHIKYSVLFVMGRDIFRHIAGEVEEHGEATNMIM